MVGSVECSVTAKRSCQNRTFAQITHPDDLQEELPLIERLWAGAIPSYSIEKRYLHQDGHSVWVRITSSLVRTSTPYRISIIEDITERRQSEEALRKLNTTLESKVAQRTAELEHRARQLQKLTLELSQTEDRERRQLAEVLHDDLQQMLAAAKFHLGILSNRIQGDPPQKGDCHPDRSHARRRHRKIAQPVPRTQPGRVVS